VEGESSIYRRWKLAARELLEILGEVPYEEFIEWMGYLFNVGEITATIIFLDLCEEGFIKNPPSQDPWKHLKKIMEAHKSESKS